ncbi:MAG: HD-GYP domain-containing protein [Halanaerobium sp.]
MQINTTELNDEFDNKNLELINSYLKLVELGSNIESIIEIIEKIDSLENESDFLNLILDKAFYLIPEADYGRIFINNGDNGYFLEKVYQKNHIFIDGLKPAVNTVNNYLGDIIFKRKYRNKSISIELKINNQYLGAVILYIAEKSRKNFSYDSQKIACSLEKAASSYLKINRYHQLQQKFKEEIILALSNLLGIHDSYTRGHNQNVADLSKELAECLGLDDSEVQKSYWSGILHDIGKTLIPAEILNKKTKLTEAEFSVIKKHPKWGYEILKDSAELNEIAGYVLYHHENWDGSGYPEGLSGDEIPLISQIVSLTDAWDAMNSNRAYRKALSKEKAVEQIKLNSGKQFSPKIVRLFLENII